MKKSKKQCQPGKENREDKIKRLSELIKNNQYVIDPELLADAILKHLGMAAPGDARRKRRAP
jgi:anti-sigma28 factor (negative regulator of flagellin synthesis)